MGDLNELKMLNVPIFRVFQEIVPIKAPQIQDEVILKHENPDSQSDHQINIRKLARESDR